MPLHIFLNYIHDFTFCFRVNKKNWRKNLRISWSVFITLGVMDIPVPESADACLYEEEVYLQISVSQYWLM